MTQKSKTLLFSLPLLCLALCSCGEDTITEEPPAKDEGMVFVREGRMWKCLKGGLYDYSYVIKGDSLIGERTYSKVYKTDEEHYGDNAPHLFSLVRQTDTKVYQRLAGNKSDALLYDFSHDWTLQVGKMKYSISSGEYRTSKWCYDVAGIKRGRQVVEVDGMDYDCQGEIFTGIGSLGDPFVPASFFCSSDALLLSCFDSDKCIFKMGEYHEIQQDLPGGDK